jgi:lipoprotein NlpI
MRPLLQNLLVSAAFVLSGRAEDISTNRVDFKIEINGRPARMVLATSLGTTLLFEPGQRRLELKGTAFSKLAPVASGGQTFSAPIPLIGNPFDRIPWLYRQLIGLMHPILYHEVKNLYGQLTGKLEGVLGWPEIRDNILVFDAGSRTIRRVEQLPPETSGWLKLKVVPDRCLLLEVPLVDGKTGTVWVDTADSRSVIMPAAQWKQWTDDHPQAAVTSHKALGLPLILTTHHEVFADEIKLGPLALTDVALEDMPPGDETRLLQETPAAKVAWTFGINALSRMDLVVDGKNGWAYLHPKPPSGVKPNITKPPAAAQNWAVADNVRVGGDNFFIYSGEYKWSTNNFTGALADFNRALELNPQNADACSDRGAIREIQGDFSGAVSDYDKVIALRPDYSDWERLYRQTLLWRLDPLPEEETKTVVEVKQAPEHAAVLKPVVVYGVQPGWKDPWARTIGLFLVGRMDEKALLAAARKSDIDTADDQKAAAYYYIGMMRLSKGDKAGARTWFKKCRSAGMTDDNEYFFAGAELKRLATVAVR